MLPFRWRCPAFNLGVYLHSAATRGAPGNSQQVSLPFSASTNMTSSIEISPYGLALIAGAFTVVGALIGAVIAYLLAIQLERRKERQIAIARLRAAFAPAMATIYLARHHGEHDRPQVGNVLKSQLLNHASAVEEFRHFARSPSYQAAWERYRSSVRESNFVIDALEWESDSALWSTLEQCIQAVLAAAVEP